MKSLNQYIDNYCKYFNLQIKNANNHDTRFIYNNQHQFLGLFKLNEKYIYINSRCYKKSDLVSAILNGVQL